MKQQTASTLESFLQQQQQRKGGGGGEGGGEEEEAERTDKRSDCKCGTLVMVKEVEKGAEEE